MDIFEAIDNIKSLVSGMSAENFDKSKLVSQLDSVRTGAKKIVDGAKTSASESKERKTEIESLNKKVEELEKSLNEKSEKLEKIEPEYEQLKTSVDSFTQSRRKELTKLASEAVKHDKFDTAKDWLGLPLDEKGETVDIEKISEMDLDKVEGSISEINKMFTYSDSKKVSQRQESPQNNSTPSFESDLKKASTKEEIRAVYEKYRT